MKKVLMFLSIFYFSLVAHAASDKFITLNVNHMPVRSAIEWFAKFHHQNFLMGSAVHGTVSLHLSHISWQKAFGILLKSQGLGEIKEGDVTYIAPYSELLRQKENQRAAKQEPLQLVIFHLNYANAKEVGALLQTKKSHFISSRGSIALDARTNSLIVQDDREHLKAIKKLITQLDVAVKQVAIEARIVNIDNSDETTLGIRFGFLAQNHRSARDLNVDLPSLANSAGRLGLAVFRLAQGTLLDLELSALQSEGKAEIISTPRLLTANQQPASIEAGEEIPYQQSAGGTDGATTIAFKKAVLRLRVTPHITPNNQLLLHLNLVQDKRSSQNFNGVPAIDTRELSTQVLVHNGQTIVLGGIYEQTDINGVDRVPFFSDLPGIGVLFKHKHKLNDRRELLIFVTPKILA